MSYFSMLYLGFFFQTKQENRYELCGLTIGNFAALYCFASKNMT